MLFFSIFHRTGSQVMCQSRKQDCSADKVVSSYCEAFVVLSS